MRMFGQENELREGKDEIRELVDRSVDCMFKVVFIVLV